MDATERILKINKVLNEGWYDDLTTSIANKFGVGDPEVAVAQRFGRGTSKRDLEAMKTDPAKQAAWIGQHGEVKKELEDVEGKLERAKEGTKFAATTLGTMGAGSAIALAGKALPAAAAAIPGAARVSSAIGRISAPVSRFMAAQGGGISPSGIKNFAKARPYVTTFLAATLGGLGAGSSDVATKWVDRTQMATDALGIVPGGVGAKQTALKFLGRPMDIANAGIDLGQAGSLYLRGKPQEAKEQLADATTRGLSALISGPAKTIKGGIAKGVGDVAINVAVPQLISPTVTGKSASQVNPREPSDPGYNKEFDELKKRQEQETQRGTQELKNLGVPGLTRRTSTSAKPPTMLASATRLGESSTYPDMETRRAEQLGRISQQNPPVAQPQQNPPVAQPQQNPPFVQKSTGWGTRFKDSELSTPEQAVRNEILFIQKGIKRPSLSDKLRQRGNWG